MAPSGTGGGFLVKTVLQALLHPGDWESVGLGWGECSPALGWPGPISQVERQALGGGASSPGAGAGSRSSQDFLSTLGCTPCTFISSQSPWLAGGRACFDFIAPLKPLVSSSGVPREEGLLLRGVQKELGEGVCSVDPSHREDKELELGFGECA